MDYEYAWDDRKARANLQKHKISFEEASSVFSDPFAVTYPDGVHSDQESRFLTFGMSFANRILIVSHTEIPTGIRIISARKADRTERKVYE
jgi:uncharacterized protein